jgi:hypothetical protein
MTDESRAREQDIIALLKAAHDRGPQGVSFESNPEARRVPAPFTGSATTRQTPVRTRRPGGYFAKRYGGIVDTRTPQLPKNDDKD